MRLKQLLPALGLTLGLGGTLPLSGCSDSSANSPSVVEVSKEQQAQLAKQEEAIRAHYKELAQKGKRK